MRSLSLKKGGQAKKRCKLRAHAQHCPNAKADIAKPQREISNHLPMTSSIHGLTPALAAIYYFLIGRPEPQRHAHFICDLKAAEPRLRSLTNCGVDGSQ